MSRSADQSPGKKPSVGARAFQRRQRQTREIERRRTVTRRRSISRSASTESLRTLFARVPTAAWICALIALLNGCAWSLITPPFQGRDEPSHFAYVQQLAESNSLPHESGGANNFSAEEERVLEGTHQEGVKLAPEAPALSSATEQQELTTDLKEEGLSRVGSGAAGVATSEPPLYYAIQTIPYGLGAGNVLTQLQLMRLVSALLASITVLFSFFFLRELLPASPRATTIATGCIAVQPLFGFMSGTLNPDTMLYTVSAGILLCLARAFRRELTTRLAIALGSLIALGFATKLNFIGLSLGIFVGIGLIGWREYKLRGLQTLRPLAIALGIGLVPVALYALVNSLTGHSTLWSAIGSVITFSNGGFFKQLSYTWQLFLPKLPGMTHYFTGIETTRNVWFDRSVGLYGWLDTMFPEWVETLALLPAGLIAIFCGRYLLIRRRALRKRLPELLTYALMIIGILAMIGHAAYSNYLAYRVAAFVDPRYLLPLLPLLGAIIVLAIRGTGRWAPMTAAVLLVTFLAHDIFSQLQTIARYYT